MGTTKPRSGGKTEPRKGKKKAATMNDERRPSLFTSRQLLECAQCSRSELQEMENAGLLPAVKGKKGGVSSEWEPLQIFGAALGVALKDNGVRKNWSAIAADVSQWTHKRLLGELAKCDKDIREKGLAGGTALRRRPPAEEFFQWDYETMQRYFNQPQGGPPTLRDIYDRVEAKLKEFLTKASCEHCPETEHQTGANYCLNCGAALRKDAPASVMK